MIATKRPEGLRNASRFAARPIARRDTWVISRNSRPTLRAKLRKFAGAATPSDRRRSTHDLGDVLTVDHSVANRRLDHRRVYAHLPPASHPLFDRESDDAIEGAAEHIAFEKLPEAHHRLRVAAVDPTEVT